MRCCEFLRSDEQSRRRTVQDALEVLRQSVGFGEHDRARIGICRMQLPSMEVVASVSVQFDPPSSEITYCVLLPSALQFWAYGAQSTKEREQFDICRLEGASVGDTGDVVCTDSALLRAVEIIPTPIPKHPSATAWRIVKHVISKSPDRRRYVRSLWLGMSRKKRRKMSDVRAVDCGTLRKLRAPPLKVIEWQMEEQYPHLPKPSSQTIANALRDFGIRIPRDRPRA